MLRKILLAALIIAFGGVKSFAQPVVSYILPDICAPGMSVYAEIYAPYNLHLGGNYNFGYSGFYDNNPKSGVRVECFNPKDTALVTFGPIFVSWHGRLISTQIFVNPGAIPQSPEWDKGIAVPFRVFANGAYSNVDTIFIVQPFRLGDVRGLGDRVLGQGALGKRSKRGAMIVDYLILADAQYTVSTSDPDFSIPGSQGYLPFILLSKDEIKGSANTSISVDGGSGMVQNAGPGGGGGGGRFCDKLFGSGSGENGGAGFTSGGPGGTNNQSGGGDHRDFGKSTGADGKSLNGVPPGYTHTYWESSGGGTGHPFGTPGEGSYTQGDDQRLGGYGGGSGYKNDQAGGSGGYATKGHGLGTNWQTGGFPHGNNCVVPIAGGSGGASGNPYGSITEVCAGSGGGGGGAIRLCADYIDNVKISAKGAIGGAPGTGHRGGHGSGGHIAAQAKLNIKNITMSAAGGSHSENFGGSGRIRWDTYEFGEGVSYPTSGESVFRGPTSDTSFYVKREHTIKGSRADNADISLWLKPDDGKWIDVSSSVTYSNPNYWEAKLDLAFPDSIFYFTALQSMPNSSSDTFLFVPAKIFSQSAANVLKIDKKCRCVPDTLLFASLMACKDSSVTDSVWIRNKGEGNLILYLENSTFEYGFPGFELVRPKERTYIGPNDSVAIVLKYTYTDWPTDNLTEILWVQTNDSSGFSKNPFEIFFTVDLERLKYNAVKSDMQTPLDTLDLGKVCPNMTAEGEFPVIHKSVIEITLVDEITPSTIFHSNITGKKNLKDGDTTLVKVFFDGASTPGKRSATLVLKNEECPDDVNFDTVIVIVNVIRTRLELTISDPLPPDIIQVRVNQRGTITATLKNDSGIPLEFDRLVVEPNPPFRVTSPDVPFWLEPGNILPVEIEFAPTSPGMYSATLTAYTSEKSGEELSCPDSVKVILNAEAIFATITLSKSTLDYGDVLWCENKLDTFYVGNSAQSSESFNIIADPVISGVSASRYTVVEKPSLPKNVAPGESVRYIVRFIPENGIVETLNAELKIETDNPVDQFLLVLLTGKRDRVFLEALPGEITDFGDVLIESTWLPKTKIHNRSKYNTNLRLIDIQHPLGDIETTYNYTDSPINALDSISIEPKFVFKTVTPLEVRLVFVSDYPCRDTLTLIYRANGIKGSLQSPDSVYFGKMAPCESSGQKIYVKNTGMTTLEIRNAEIRYGDAFSFYEPPQLPITIVPGDSAYFAITFDPGSKSEGSFTDFLVVTALIDNKQQIIEVKLFGELFIGLEITPDSLYFGKLTLGKTKSMPFDIKINADRQLLIMKLLPAKHYPAVFTEAEPKIDNLTLEKFQNKLVTINFTPDQLITYLDTIPIQIRYLPFCTEPDTVNLIVFAEGSTGVTVQIWLPDTTVNPKLNDFKLPVYARVIEQNESIDKLLIDNIELSFDRTLFYPVSVDRGEIYKNIAVNNSRTIGIKDILYSNLTNNQATIVNITGYTMLGETASTLIEPANIFFNDISNVTDFEKYSGNLKIEFCEEGGDRLLSIVSPRMLMIAPNPADDELEITIKTAESGNCSVEIINPLGQSHLLKKWTNGMGGGEKVINLDLKEYPSGVYFVVFTTSGGKETQRVMIVK